MTDDPAADPRLLLEMQRVALDRDDIPHNVGWMAAASEDELLRQGQDAEDASQLAWYTRPGPEADERERWWLGQIDDELKRREDWTERDIARRNERYERRAQREADTGIAGRAYRALYRLRDEVDQRTKHGLDYWGKPGPREIDRER